MADVPEGYREIPEGDRKKAAQFFERGTSVAGTGNYDYAIEMYMQGLAIDPDSVEAHQALRDISLKRKATGGKPIGMLGAMGMRRPTKDEKTNLLNNVQLLANDPGNTDYMVGVLQNAHKGGFYDTAMWMGPILQKANADSAKPDFKKFIILKDVYKALGKFKLATEACNYAVLMRPDDMDLQKELKDLGAQHTMDEGNYATGKSFRDSIKDVEGQEKLMRQDTDVRTSDQMAGLIRDAERDYLASPEEPGKLTKYVDLLVKTDLEANEERAIDLLQREFDRTKQFRFRLRVGEIRMRQWARQERILRQQVTQNRSDELALREYRTFARQKAEWELAEYKLAYEAYPTDMRFKFEAGMRMFLLERFGESIPVFQDARRDPKYRTDATIALGRAFLSAGFSDEAVDTLKGVIDDYQLRGDGKSIDMYYWYGRSLEEKGDAPAALKAYSQVAQWNFNYRDVQARIKKLRTSAGPTG